MRPDSLSFLSVNVPEGSLPPWVLGLLLVGFFVLAGMLIQKAAMFKTYSTDFPTQSAPVVIALALFIASAPVILSRMALGLEQVGGTGDWLAALCALAGVSAVGLGVKRFSSPEYQEGKAKVEAAKAAATPPQVNVAGDARVQTSATNKPSVAPTRLPAVGVKPSDPEIVRGLEALAGLDGLPFKGVPDDAQGSSTEEAGLG